MWDYFTDPILRAPTIGCILLCVSASLMGVILFLQKRLLIGESVSHAAYPGAIAAIFALAWIAPEWEEYAFLAVLGGALISSWLGLRTIGFLERRGKVRNDAALCFTLALFFGAGVLLSSWLQTALPGWVGQAQTLLFGQAATLTDEHVFIYGAVVFACALFIALAFRPLQALLFDREFGISIGLPTRTIERALLWLLLFSIVLGIRSVGVILMSGMLIAPAVAARQFSNRLKTIFWLAALFGGCSGLLGSVLSVEIAIRFPELYLPTGPMIVLVGSLFALFGLLCSPKRGILFRLARLASFRLRCLEENMLKGIWKKGVTDVQELKRHYPPILGLVLLRLARQGWIIREGSHLRLTHDGQARAAAIVRLHRLWELYLTEQLGVHVEQVHRSAEEIEHVLTPELEARLTHILSNPKRDPHQQPIPEGGRPV